MEKINNQVKAERLINHLEQSEDIVGFRCYNSEDYNWNYYYSISGFLYGEYYFQMYITSWKSIEDFNVRISEVTDCIPEIKKLLKQFSLTVTEK